VRPELQRWQRDLARATRRHRGLLSAGLAAAAVAAALPTLAPPAPPTVQLVAAAHDLAAGTPLAAADLRVVSWPRSVAPAGALATVDDVVGRVLAGPVRTGEALTDVRLIGAALLARGTKLVAAPVRLADPATAALLRAGDHVDVLAVRTTEPQAAAVTVASGLSVLAVPAPGEADPDGALVVLAATPDTAARLAAAAVGSRLSVTVVAP
jgi:Flp pilus assembly protein CpaB